MYIHAINNAALVGTMPTRAFTAKWWTTIAPSALEAARVVNTLQCKNALPSTSQSITVRPMRHCSNCWKSQVS